VQHYTEVTFILRPLDPWRDILIAELGEQGYDSFEETAHGVKAYVQSDRFDRAALGSLLTVRDPHVDVSHTIRQVEPRNWNEEWERSFQPVEVRMPVPGDHRAEREGSSGVRIRAEFHPFVPGFAHDIVITPRMAFGTGHHATTRMMVEAMLRIDMSGQPVCDLGCGTAVLAILAERMGARDVRAIDIDEQAVMNARENVALNNCKRIIVDKGDVALLDPASCGVILANIERNTLLRDMLSMRDALLPGGALLLSGFVNDDRPLMLDAVKAAGMHPAEALSNGEWALIGCRR
jgi:ribosomal protein L11 methyltransferase